MLLANFQGILVIKNKGISPEMLIVIKGVLNGHTNVRLQAHTYCRITHATSMCSYTVFWS